MKEAAKNARRLLGLGTRAVPSCQHWDAAYRTIRRPDFLPPNRSQRQASYE